MCIRILTAAFLSLALLVQNSWAQGKGKLTQVDELRRQMAALQKQLDGLESDDGRSIGKVAELGATRQMRGEPSLIVRIYDLSDLFTVAPAYPASIGNDLGFWPRLVFPEAAVSMASHPAGSGMMGGMGMGGMGGAGFFSVSERQVLKQGFGGGGARAGNAAPASAATTSDMAAATKTTINALIDAIENTIEPDSWENLSGPGSISRLGTSLVVRNNANVHDQIEALFALLRQKWNTLRTVSVSAWWLPLGDEQLAKLLPGNGKGKTGVDGIEAFGVVDDAAWNALRAAAAPAGRQAPPGYRAVVTCSNGQTVNTISGAEEAVVNDIEPIVARGENNRAEGRTAYKPMLMPVHEGAVLQITPLVNASGKFVMLDVHSRVAVREPAGRRQAAREEEQGPGAVVAALDRPRLSTQRLATTLRAPIDRVMLVGGMTLSPGPQGDERTLYLFLRTTVQELRDDVRRGTAVEKPEVDAGKADE